jgi:hypothetical protein
MRIRWPQPEKTRLAELWSGFIRREKPFRNGKSAVMERISSATRRTPKLGSRVGLPADFLQRGKLGKSEILAAKPALCQRTGFFASAVKLILFAAGNETFSVAAIEARSASKESGFVTRLRVGLRCPK